MGRLGLLTTHGLAHSARPSDVMFIPNPRWGIELDDTLGHSVHLRVEPTLADADVDYEWH